MAHLELLVTLPTVPVTGDPAVDFSPLPCYSTWQERKERARHKVEGCVAGIWDHLLLSRSKKLQVPS